MEGSYLQKHIGLLERFLLLWMLTIVIGHCILGLSILKICGTSMASTFDDGDYVLAIAVRDCTELHRGDGTLISYTAKLFPSLEHGDVITFHPTPDSQTAYIKRVVGLSGDIIEAQNDLLFINGKSDGYSQLGTGTWGPITVPPNAVFVLGDNRAVSVDSRTIGCIPLQQICTKVIGKGVLLS